jgi:hypothetical protein
MAGLPQTKTEMFRFAQHDKYALCGVAEGIEYPADTTAGDRIYDMRANIRKLPR